MNNKRMVLKVGVFVLIGLVLAAAMVMRFSKGTGLSTTYRLGLRARNAGGIIPGANVLMAGVPIGSVSEIRLAEDGSKVTMMARIYSRFRISKDAVFGIATVGFLGDRFVSVSPNPARKKNDPSPGYLKDGDFVQVEEAFDITAVAQSASTLMDRLSATVLQLNTAVQRLDKTLLADQSLTNLTQMISNLKSVSDRALTAMDTINHFLNTNTVSLSQSVTNIQTFTEKLNAVTLELHETVATNRTQLTSAMKNIDHATERADRILREVEEGKGLAGTLLHSEQFAEYTSTTLSNLMIFSSNLNQKGLWGVIRKPKPAKDEK
jgi:phospholipid/cholesterol/gamma-HCH transport system substrate-binding protein